MEYTLNSITPMNKSKVNPQARCLHILQLRRSYEFYSIVV